MAYAWIEKGWDGNQDGVMEGSQHNTMDVNYFGPNPQMGFWYMGALRAAEEMALAMKDRAFAKKCRKLFECGSAWMDANLFNGEYYEHKITDPNTFAFLDMNALVMPCPDSNWARDVWWISWWDSIWRISAVWDIWATRTISVPLCRA